MAYSDKQNKYNQQYVRECQKRFSVKYKKDFYEAEVEPYIKASGYPAATFAKIAIEEKILRDFPMGLPETPSGK